VKNLRDFSRLSPADSKNRTGMGTHPGAGKASQFQADYGAMSGGLNLDSSDQMYMIYIRLIGAH
jgi:hypothetical protein